MPEARAETPGFVPESLLGSVIDGRYRLTGHIATGGMGAVFRAEHVLMKSALALKVLRPDLTASSEIAERFRREAEIAASLRHENIVRVTDFGRSPEGYLFLAMELLEGESLFERLRRKGALAPREAVQILVQMCAALDAAHRRGVVHRDLKPENVFLDRHVEGRTVVKILDFGIAKITDPRSRSATASGMVVGTPEYLSPEQAVGGVVDARADIYAVGLVAWRMLVGRHPFPVDDPRALLMMQATQPVPPLAEARPELAAYPGLVAAVGRACAKGAGERHRSAAELRREFQRCAGEAAKAVPSAPVPAGPIPLRETEALTPTAAPSLAQAQRIRMARLGSSAQRLWRRLGEALRTVPGALGDLADLARLHPRLVALAAGAVLAALVAAGTVRYVTSRPAERGRELLEAGQAETSLDYLKEAVRLAPRDPGLLCLQGRALHESGRRPAAYEAWEAALALSPEALDTRTIAALVSDLSRDRRTADHAARLLVRSGPRAAQAVLAATGDGPGFARLKALEVARDLGVEERVPRVAAYAGLLTDPECDVRSAAARPLGDIGSAEALPRLRELARARTESRGFLGTRKSEPACGAAEAAEAARRIEAGVPR